METKTKAAGFRLVTAALLVLSLAGIASPFAAVPASASGPTISASMAALDVTTNSTGPAHPGDTVRYTVTINNTGSGDAGGVDFENTVDTNTSVNTNSLDVSPLAQNDAYPVLGNVPITVNAANGVLFNDHDPDGDTLSVDSSSTGTHATVHSGSINLSSDGSFTYTPPTGYQASDTFDYKVSDGHSTDTATITFNISGMIWFINNAAQTDGDGSLNSPFNNISSFNTINTNAGTNHPGTGDTIFVYTGSSGYAGNLTLKDGQFLLGQGAGKSIVTYTGLTLPGNSPSLPATSGSNPTLTGNITLGKNNNIQGLNISATSGTAVTGSAGGNFTMGDSVGSVAVSNSGGGAVVLSGYKLSVNLASVSSNGAGSGISIDNSDIASTFKVSTVNLINSTGTALSDTSTSNFGSFEVDGGTIDSTSGAQAVNLSHGTINVTLTHINDDGNASLPSAIVLASTTGPFTVTGGSGACTSSTPTCSGGTIQNTTQRGASFTSISPATSGATTVSLNLMQFKNADTTTSNTCSDDPANASFTGCYADVYFNSASNVSLTHILVNGNNSASGAGQEGINANTVAGLTLTNSEVLNVGAKSTSGSNLLQSGLQFANVTGTVTLTGDTIHDSGYDNLDWHNNTGTLSAASISNDTFDTTGTGTHNGSNNGLYNIGILDEATATMAVTITGDTIKNANNDGLHVDGSQSNSADPLTIQVGSQASPNTFTNDYSSAVYILGRNSSHINYNVNWNTTTGSHASAIAVANLNGQVANADFLQGFIEHNSIGTNQASSITNMTGAGIGANGIDVESDNAGENRAVIESNTIYGVDAAGIYVSNGAQIASSPVLNVTIENNTIDQQNADALAGIDLVAGTDSSFDTGGTFCADTRTNTIAHPASYPTSIFMDAHSEQFNMPGYAGGSTNDAAAAAYMASLNANAGSDTNGNIVATSQDLSPAKGSWGNDSGSATCAQPSNSLTALAVFAADNHMEVARTAGSAGAARHGTAVKTPRATAHAVVGHSMSARRSHGAFRSLDHSISSTAVSVSNFTLPAGHTVKIIFTVTVNHDITAGSISNSATLTWTGNQTPITVGPATTTVMIDTSAALTSSQNPSNVGQQVTFTDTITNTEANGTATPTGSVQFKDNGTNLGSAVALSGSGTTATATFQTSSLNLGNHPITADYTPTGGTGFQAQTGTALTGGPNQQVIGPDLSVTKTADAAAVSAGDSMGYTITLSNAADGATAQSPTISDTLPGGTGVSWSVDQINGSAPGNSPACAISGPAPTQSLSCTFGDMAASSSDSVHITSGTSAASCGSYANQATGGASNTSATPASASVTITVQCPSLTLTKTADAATVSAGATIGFTIQVSNSNANGTGTAKNVRVSDPLPPGPNGSQVSWSIDTNSPNAASCSISGQVGSQTLGCNFGNMTAGLVASVHVTSSTTYSSCGAYTNKATLTADNAASSDASDTTTVQCPGLSLTKTADHASVSAGSSIGYTITASNSQAGGTGTASGVTLSDPLPAGTGVSWSIDTQPNSGTCAINGNAPSQTLSCSFGAMAAGASNSVHVTSSTTAASCAAYSNTATLSATNAPDVTASDSITVQCPSISVTKTADSANVVEGQSMGYTMTVSNSSANGTGIATGVAINDPLPGGGGVSWSIDSQPNNNPCSITGSAPSQTLACAFGSLAPGASASVHVTSGTSTASCGTYNNTATASATNQSASVTDSASIGVGCATITLTKTADNATVSAGAQIGYSLVVGNTGPQTALTPTLSDQLPSGSGVSWTIALQPGGSPCAITGSNPQTLACTFSDLAVTSTYTVHVTSNTTSASCTTYDNSASAAATNSPQATASASITVECPNLSVTKARDAATVSAGDTIGYTITASNSQAAGTGTAAGVSVSDPLPGGTGVSWSIASQPGGNPCSVTGSNPQTLSCAFSSMAPGASKSVHVTSATTGSSCGSYANTTSLSATNEAGSQTASATTTVQCPSLSLGKSSDAATVSAGTQIGYTLSLSNSSVQGTGTAKSVQLSDPLPGGPSGSGVSWSIANQSPGTPCQITGSTGSQTLACSFGDLAPGGSGSVHITSATGANSCGDYANTATLTATNASNVTASTTITVQCPKLSITKTADNATVNAGSQAGYTITAANSNSSGTGTATSVSVTDALPGGSGVSWSIASQPVGNPCQIAGTSPQTLTCTYGTMAPGATNSVHVTATTNGATCGQIQNTASLSASNIPAALTDSAKITIQCPSLSISKTADSATVSAGTSMGYVITAGNSSTSGTGTATSVSLSDPLPGGSGVSWSIASQPGSNPCSITTSNGNQTLSCTLGSMVAGASASVHITSPTTAAGCQSYANTATLSASNMPASLTNAATIVVNCPHLTLSKSADHAVVNEGGQIGFKLQVGNTGLGTAAGVTLTDHLPAGSGLSWSLNPAVSGCAITLGTLTCTIGSFAPGSTETVHVTSSTNANSCATFANTGTLTSSNNAIVTAQASLSVACPTQSIYTGTQAVVIGKSFVPSAQVAGSSKCTAAGTFTFAIDHNPLGQGANPFPVSAAISAGAATGTTLSTAGWAAGVYTITASYSGPAFCQVSSDSATLTVGVVGLTAGLGAAAGKYTAPNSTTPYTLEFTFSALHGQIQLLNSATWQLKGALLNLVRAPGGDGAANGLGTLTLGSITITNVTFTISFHANAAPYTFGIHINRLPTGTQPAFPSAPPVPLTAGAIHLT